MNNVINFTVNINGNATKVSVELDDTVRKLVRLIRVEFSHLFHIKILNNKSDLKPVFKKDKDNDKFNKPPKPNIVTPLSVQTEMTSLLASQNEIIVKMQATMKSMDERIKKLEEGGSDGGGTTGEDGKEENKEDYD